MSHRLLSKKIGIVILMITCTFLGMAYAWMYYTDQWIAGTELPVQEPATEEAAGEPGGEAEAAAETAFHTQAPLAENSLDKFQVPYPCVVKMQQGKIGVFTQDDICIRELIQVGEWLSERDQKLLQQGIAIENEQDLIMVLESYHLQ